MADSIDVMVEYVDTEDDARFWLDILVERELTMRVGPFETIAERQRALDDMLQMVREHGGIDMPRGVQ